MADMAAAAFPRMGQVTFGNPNHYNGSGLMLRELRARVRDSDCPQGAEALRDLEESFREETGVKLTESSAVKHEMGDVIGDLLSDMAPQGVEFGVRCWPDGNHNYGYYLPG